MIEERKNQTESFLRVLHLEDSARDHELIREILANEGIRCEFCCVKTRPEFEARLEQQEFDLILSDFAMPGYDGSSALEKAQATKPETPFIFVSGTIGEERAVESLKTGATDYVLKGNLRRLAPAILRALREAKERAGQRLTERALRESQERLVLATQASNVGLWEWDIESNRVYLSPQWKAQLGYSDEELPNSLSTWESRLHPEDREQAMSAVRAFGGVEGEALEFECRLLHKDGSYRWILTRGRSFKSKAGKPTRKLGCNLDITERKQAEQARLADKAKFRRLVEQPLAGIYVIQDERFAYVNPKMTDIFGFSESELLSRPVLDFIVPADRPLAAENIRRRMAGEVDIIHYQLRMLRKNGAEISVEVHGGISEYNGRPAILGMLLDVTEKRDMETQLLRSQRLESLGTLAGGIAHDLNNVLAPIMMAIEILRVTYNDTEADQILATIESSAQRGAEMVKQVLTFARGVQGERVTLQSGHVIREVAKILSQTFPKSIEIRTVLAKQLWPVVGDATQLHQVLMNLCVNARDAMPQGGVLALEADNFFSDEPFVAMNVEARAGPYVMISIKDTGTGIPAPVLERMFEPFYTTKTLEKGTGLGLSTVRGIVKSHGGFVKVCTELGQGSEFQVFLPAQESAGTGPAEIEPDGLPAGRGEVVLVVDDEAAVLSIARKTLQRFGYHVLTASDGAEAIGLCAQPASGIKVMVTDMMMPVLDGLSTIKAVRRIAPKIKIIATSGLGGHPDLTNPNQLKIDAVLQKPYTANQLLKTVQRVLIHEDRPQSNEIGETAHNGRPSAPRHS